jgi:hypothetical protein
LSLLNPGATVRYADSTLLGVGRPVAALDTEPLVQPVLDLGRGEVGPLALVTGDDDSCGGHAGETGES